jgi:hypothetical protein
MFTLLAKSREWRRGCSRSDMELRLRKNSRASFAKPRSSRSLTSVRFRRAAATRSWKRRRGIDPFSVVRN